MYEMAVIDPNKKVSLVQWINRLCDDSLKRFEDLLDCHHFILLVRQTGEKHVPETFVSREEAFEALKSYLESFYQTSFATTKQLDFNAVVQRNISPARLEWELAKILLALIGALCQENSRERFVLAALNLDLSGQYAFKELLEAVVDPYESRLPPDFAEVLKKKTDTCAHLDATVLFKLVSSTNGLTPTSVEPSSSGQNTSPAPGSSHAPKMSLMNYSCMANSPAPGNLSIRDISSPLRGLSITNSPQTPLGQLINSPQFAQKAMLRQKEQDLRKAEASLQQEKDRRVELEFDLQELRRELGDKEQKLAEMERHMVEARRLRFQLEEMEGVSSINEKLEGDLARMQCKLNELHDLKDRNKFLEKESKEFADELQIQQERVKKLEVTALEVERLKDTCHHQEITLTELQAKVDYTLGEMEETQCSRDEYRSLYEESVRQLNRLKKEKEEQDMMVACGPISLELQMGEPMSVVTDKRVSELQAENQLMLSTWARPEDFQKLQSALESEQAARATYEAKFMEIKKENLAASSRNDHLESELKKANDYLSQLQLSVEELQNREKKLRQENDTLTDREQKLQKVYEESHSQLEATVNQVKALEGQKSKLQAELGLVQSELELQQSSSSEYRRQTIAQVDSLKSERNQVEQQLARDRQELQNSVDSLKTKLKSVKEEAEKCQSELTNKLQVAEQSLSKLKKTMENDTAVHCNQVKELKKSNLELDLQLKEVTAELEKEKITLKREVEQISTELSNTRDDHKNVVQELEEACEKLKGENSKAQSEAEAKHREVVAQKNDIEHELQRVKLDMEASEESSTLKLEKLKARFQDKENSLRNEIDNLKSRNTAQSQKERNLEENIRKLNCDISNQQSEIASLNRTIEQFKRGDQEWNEKFENLKLSKLEIEQSLKKLTNTLQAEREERDIMSREKDADILSLQNEITSLERNFKLEKDSMTQVIHKLESDLIHQKDQFNSERISLNKDLENCKLENSKLIDSLTDEYETKFKTLEESKETQKKEADEAKDCLIKEVEEMKCTLQETRCNMEEKDKELSAIVDQQTKEISEMEEKLKVYKNTEYELRCNVEVCQANYDAIRNVLDQKEEEKVKHEKVVAEKDSRIIDLEEKIGSLNKNNEELKGKVNSLEEQVDMIKTALESERSSLQQVSAEKEQLCLEFKSDRDSLESDHMKKVVQLETEYQKQLSFLKDRLTETEESVQSLRDNSNRTHKELVEKYETRIGDMKSEFEIREKELRDSHCSLQNELKRQYSEVSSNLDRERQMFEEKYQNIESSSRSQIEQLEEVYVQKLEKLQSEHSCVQADLKRQLDEVQVQLESERKLYEEKRLDIETQSKSQLKQLEESYTKKVEDMESEHRSEGDSLNKQLEEVCAQLKKERQEFEEKLIDTESKWQLQMEKEQKIFEDRRVDIESYWQSQLEQLEEEYSKGTEENKQEYQQLLTEQEEKFEAQVQALLDDKEAAIASQAAAFQMRISELEALVSKKKKEIEELKEKLCDAETDYTEKMSHLETVLKEKSEKQQVISEEVIGYKRKLNELETTMQQEQTKFEDRIAELETNHSEQVQSLTSDHENKVAALKSEFALTQTDSLEQASAEFNSKISGLKCDMNHQKAEFEQQMNDLNEASESRLASQAVDYEERLSQMKCQYEQHINTLKYDSKSQVSELEGRLLDLEDMKLGIEEQVQSLQNELGKERLSRSEAEKKLEKVEGEVSTLQNELTTALNNWNQEKSKREEVEEDLSSVKSDLEKHLAETEKLLSIEKGERAECERQLTYTQERSDTLMAELSSQQQQLAAVEEEKRLLEAEKQAMCEKHDAVIREMNADAERDLAFIRMEKQGLEREMQSMQKCFDHVQTHNQQLESRISELESLREQAKSSCRDLEQRERGLHAQYQAQVDKATEYNGTLRRQLDEKCVEVENIRQKYNQQLDELMSQSSEMKRSREEMTEEMRTREQKLQQQISELQSRCDAADNTCSKLEKDLTSVQLEKQKQKEKHSEILEKYNLHYNKKKEEIKLLKEELENRKDLVNKLTDKVKEKEMALAPTKQKLDAEVAKNKALNKKVNSLEVQVEHADRQVRDLRSQLDKAGTILLGDDKEFQRVMGNKENAVDASFMHTDHGQMAMMNDSLDNLDHTAKPVYNLRSSSLDRSTDLTLTPGTRSSRRPSKSFSNITLLSGMTPGAASINSATNMVYRLRSRESAASLNRSITSTDSARSISAVPRGTGGMFQGEDEPMEMEWGRLSELKRRNTLCQPHLKTSYPVETQTIKPDDFKDEELKDDVFARTSSRKRKPSDEKDPYSHLTGSASKLAKCGTVYHKPGPPTPANARRNSGKGSNSPATPGSSHGRKKFSTKTPRRASKASVENSTPGSNKKANKRESIAFNIGFSPRGATRRLTRQKAFVQKQPLARSTGQNPPAVQVQRKPLGTRNFLQTGL